MKRGENFNRPQPGSDIRVEPIKKIKDIRSIKKLLADKPRDLALFVLGVNTNLRASDLLRITIGQVRDLKSMGEISLAEKKTGKKRRISLNRPCIEAIQTLLQAQPQKQNHEPLFTGQRGPLTVPTVNRLVKSWCRAINLQGNYGSHTLRKTWGYHQRVTFGVDLPRLVHCFNHSTQRQTLEYLCIQPEEIQDVYANEL